jgi:hypothetical protein
MRIAQDVFQLMPGPEASASARNSGTCKPALDQFFIRFE